MHNQFFPYSMVSLKISDSTALLFFPNSNAFINNMLLISDSSCRFSLLTSSSFNSGFVSFLVRIRT